jgi:hypothetical protein
MSKKRILFVAMHYPNRAPGQRFRFEQYFSYLEKIYSVFNNKSIVNLTMGKTPILKYLNK